MLMKSVINFNSLRHKRNAAQKRKSAVSRSSSKKRQKMKDRRIKRQASIIKDVYDGESVGENWVLIFDLAYFDFSCL